MIKKILAALLALPLLLHLFQLSALHYDGNFTTRQFAHGFDKSYAEVVEGLDYTILNTALEQPYRYLGQGKQMIAFVSADEKYVLKFFNPMRPLKNKWYTHSKYWKRYSSIKWIGREWFGKKERLHKLFSRHKIAYELLKDETGLLFAHLCPKKQVCHLVQVTDKKGKAHLVPLSKTPFILQERAELAANYFGKLLRNNQRKEALEALRSMESLFEKRLAAGITDRIQTMENNYGFVGKKPIQIDVGRIQLDTQLQVDEERERIITNFRQWTENSFDLSLNEPLDEPTFELDGPQSETDLSYSESETSEERAEPEDIEDQDKHI